MAIRKGTRANDLMIARVDAEQFDGSSGYDIVSYALATSGVTIDLLDATLNTGFAEGDTFTSIESFRLSAHSDTFDGGKLVDSVNGGLGDDVIRGRDGKDQLNGHTGNDTLDGGTGNDGLWGGGNNDTIYGGDGNDNAVGDSGNDTIKGDAGADLITGGTDTGRMKATLVETSAPFIARNGTVLSLADALVEVNFGPKVMMQGWQGHANWTGPNIPITKVGEVDGNSIYIMTNNTNITTQEFQLTSYDSAGGYHSVFAMGSQSEFRLNPGESVMINLGQFPDSDQPNEYYASFYGSGGFKQSQFNMTDAEISSNAAAGQATGFSSLVIGDRLTGGTDADKFVFANGHGVDLISDFQAGVDKIDLANSWFDGRTSNGEFKAIIHADGAVILFTDTSADGFVDNMAIQLAGITAAEVKASYFI